MAKDLVARMNEQKKGCAVSAIGKAETGIEVIPTGILSLDQALGIYGWPQGRIVEIYGPESVGKTTLCLLAIVQAQAIGLDVLFVDAEHALDLSYAETLGVDLPTLAVAQPDNGEDALETARVGVRAGARLIIIDSVAALTPKKELDGEIGDSHVGLQARLMGQTCRVLAAEVHAANATVIFINQTRSKIGVVYGSPTTTPGGMALKFYASVRVELKRGGRITKRSSVVGEKIIGKVVKNKLAPPFCEGSWEIVFGRGIDKETDLFTAALDAGVIKKRKRAYVLADGTALGEGDAPKGALTDPELFERVLDMLLTARSAPSNQPEDLLGEDAEDEPADTAEDVEAVLDEEDNG